MYRYVFIMLKIVLSSYLIFLIIYILSEKKINNIHTTFVYRYIRIVFLCLCIYIITFVQNKPHIIYKLSNVNCFTPYTGAQNLCIYITFLLNKPHIIYKLSNVNCFTPYTGAQNVCIYIITFVQNKPRIIYKLCIVNCFTQYTGAQNL